MSIKSLGFGVIAPIWLARVLLDQFGHPSLRGALRARTFDQIRAPTFMAGGRATQDTRLVTFDLPRADILLSEPECSDLLDQVRQQSHRHERSRPFMLVPIATG